MHSLIEVRKYNAASIIQYFFASHFLPIIKEDDENAEKKLRQPE